MTSKDSPVVIVGAGVIGISIAYRIAQLNPYADITIISKDFPNTGLLKAHYTSSKSGAHFRPFPSKNEFEARDSKFTHATYKHFKELAFKHPESSIKFITGYDYIEYDNELYSNLSKGYTEVVEDFKVIPKSELPKGVKFGASYKTFSVNPHVYMNFMLDSLILRQNAKLIQREVKSLKEVTELYPSNQYPIFINCTGNGLLFNGSHDPECFPIRGQTLLVRPPLEHLESFNSHTTTYQLANGEWCFTIPRPLNGGIILGGTKQIGLNTETPIAHETEQLIANAKSRFPKLFHPETKQLDIMRVNVGFRPARKSGVRLEREVVSLNDADRVIVVHCYGFGGSGVEMSWGAAELAADLALASNGAKL